MPYRALRAVRIASRVPFIASTVRLVKVLRQLFVSRHVQQDLGFDISGHVGAFVDAEVPGGLDDNGFYFRDVPDVSLSECAVQVSGGDAMLAHHLV
jgi:hypothetical protein